MKNITWTLSSFFSFSFSFWYSNLPLESSRLIPMVSSSNSTNPSKIQLKYHISRSLFSYQLNPLIINLWQKQLWLLENLSATNSQSSWIKRISSWLKNSTTTIIENWNGEKLSEVTIQSNPKFDSWTRIDQSIMSWLLTSIIELVCGYVVRCQNVFEVWKTFERVFVTKSKARILQLKYLFSFMKKGSMPIGDYMLTMKSITYNSYCHQL